MTRGVLRTKFLGQTEGPKQFTSKRVPELVLSSRKRSIQSLLASPSDSEKLLSTFMFAAVAYVSYSHDVACFDGTTGLVDMLILYCEVRS